VRQPFPVGGCLVDDAIYTLSRSGPALGRPLVGTITRSKIANLKELRPGSRVSVTWVDLWPTVSLMSWIGTPLLLMIETAVCRPSWACQRPIPARRVILLKRQLNWSDVYGAPFSSQNTRLLSCQAPPAARRSLACRALCLVSDAVLWQANGASAPAPYNWLGLTAVSMQPIILKIESLHFWCNSVLASRARRDSMSPTARKA
jgi:hypothetical protein